MEMQYRHLGRSGLKVSVLSFGSWVSFGPQLAGSNARDCLAAAYDAGVNFFDNAEVYSGGRSESIMGEAIAELGWPRHTYVISSKFFWGIEDSVNTRNTLNRKYLLHAVDGSLRRLGLDFLDLIFCHRADPETPIEETVRVMHEIITSGRARLRAEDLPAGSGFFGKPYQLEKVAASLRAMIGVIRRAAPSQAP